MHSYIVQDHYDVYLYDESWCVNDSREAGTLTFLNEPTDEMIIDKLVLADLLSHEADVKEFEFGGDDLMITIDGPMTDGQNGPYFTLLKKEAEHDGRD